ncbi:class II fructose-1,6-bisphosphate aldolase [Vagococcus fluvialis]|uniref:Class II fructose-1,6-bisphosphate aldolase n=1 Tax=Vagococcus fluvialis TaxID=2738 RepID=A0A7X6I1Z5_9ENTE|nr:class II fructose-1,6-bisphosphate aldolase [Vagococcus fluvialis]NKC66983.1 class II fructose-1,6-bisphosphate aldolase [Vagococcus fluvialis]
MTFANLNDVLIPAKKEKYAIGQFNINGYDWIEAILLAAEIEKAPVIIAASDRLVDFLGGFNNITQSVATFKQMLNITVPVVLHLDHGQSVERCIEAIDAGFSSVMIDGSHSPIETNIAMTKKVVDYAHSKGVSVEAEVGTVGGNEDGLVSGIQYASFDECLSLVNQTGVDALAAALGSVHGKYVGKPILGFEEMKALSESCNIPLVLHGASGIPQKDLDKTITFGHAKININTEINQVWFKSISEHLAQNPDSHEPKVVIEPTKTAMINAVRQKIVSFGSKNKAL